ncbi:hypothetical protein AC1031_019642 [Aphanomyces cochlioides]|nr:hypothetical protein AC1031_019642 [Aphanomyces cochlioides]
MVIHQINFSPVMQCYFNSCHNPPAGGTDKCDFHRNRGKCNVADCRNQVYARNLCVKHGGKRACQAPGCDKNTWLGGFCCKHNALIGNNKCSEVGCTNMAHARQKCIRHGGGRKCEVPDCTTQARAGGYCSRHGRQMLLGDTEGDDRSAKKASDEVRQPSRRGSYDPIEDAERTSREQKEPDAATEGTITHRLSLLSLQATMTDSDEEFIRNIKLTDVDFSVLDYFFY